MDRGVLLLYAPNQAQRLSFCASERSVECEGERLYFLKLVTRGQQIASLGTSVGFSGIAFTITTDCWCSSSTTRAMPDGKEDS